jgi:hypothetical protein
MANTVRSVPCPITALGACIIHPCLAVPPQAYCINGLWMHSNPSCLVQNVPLQLHASHYGSSQLQASHFWVQLHPYASPICIGMPHQCAYGPAAATGFSTIPAWDSHIWPLHTPEMLNLYAPATHPRQQQPAAVVPSCLTRLLHGVLRSALFACAYLPLALLAVFPLGLGCSGGWWHLTHPPG